jgi:UDP-MurNAc hydroxylase
MKGAKLKGIVRVTYYGQACTLIEAGGKKILTDPWLTEGAYFGTWFHTHILADAGVTPETLPKDIDYLFLSHEHRDHLDVTTLRRFAPDTPLLICKFATPKLRNYLKQLGFPNVRENESGHAIDLGDGVVATILNTAEYTNDSALLVEHEGVRVFNETDCKLGYDDLEQIGEKGVDIGFYMFSGANWYPMLYDYPEEVQMDLIRRRRRDLMRSFVQRVKLTQPRIAVPAAGPCTVLDPERLWLNTEERGIFIDPELAVRALQEEGVASQPLYMAASDVWDSATGFEPHAPASFRKPRQEYIREASERMAPQIAAARAAEKAANPDLGRLLEQHFNTLVAAQTPAMRRRINARLAFAVSGPRGGNWTVDFGAAGPNYVREGIAPDWTYKIEVEDKLISPFVTGEEPFFEDLLLSLRFQVARRPDEFNEPLYHFLYEPDPEKLHNWYATR